MISLRSLVREASLRVDPSLPLPDLPVKGIECDSRKVERDFVFVAVRGTHQDGHAFIHDAVGRGAAAVVAERPLVGMPGVPFLLVPECRQALGALAGAFYGHPSRNLRMIGITGTNGKTTSSYLVEYLLSREHRTVGVIGTVNYRFGGREIPAVETTPGPLKIQQMLSLMVAAGCQVAVMEVSSHALDQDRVSGIAFEAGLFTNLTQDHLDYHRTFEAYFACKARLFDTLSKDASAVVNADDEWGRKLLSRTRAKVLTYAVKGPADLTASRIEPHLEGTDFDLGWRKRTVRVRSPLVGLHNVYNVLGAFGVLAGLGYGLGRAAESLERFKGVPGRLEPVRAGQNFMVFVDFAHTPDGLENVLTCLKPYAAKKLIVLFGCGGDRDREKRPRMARLAAQFCGSVYVTTDNPRSEDPKAIAEEVCAGFPHDFKDFTVVLDRKKAIRQALLAAREGDIVLLAGKGHETVQIVGNERLPFSDREEAERVLRGD